MAQEEKLVSASYIVQLYNDLENLNNTYPIYVNALTSLKSKYKKEDLSEGVEDLEEQEKQELILIVNTLRALAIKSFIRIKTLEDKLTIKKEKLEKLENLHKHIKESLLPLEDSVLEYVIGVNKVFSNSVMSEIFLKATDIIAKSGASA